MTAFNEDSRVKIPALLHPTRLGYQYLPLKQAKWDTRTQLRDWLLRLLMNGQLKVT